MMGTRRMCLEAWGWTPPWEPLLSQAYHSGVWALWTWRAGDGSADVEFWKHTNFSYSQVSKSKQNPAESELGWKATKEGAVLTNATGVQLLWDLMLLEDWCRRAPYQSRPIPSSSDTPCALGQGAVSTGAISGEVHFTRNILCWPVTVRESRAKGPAETGSGISFFVHSLEPALWWH